MSLAGTALLTGHEWRHHDWIFAQMRHFLPVRLYGVARATFQYCFPGLAYRRLTSEKWREEEIEMDLLPALVDPGRDAVDVGANVGHYAVKLATLAKRVYAFEPHPRLAYILKRSLPANVMVRHQAVSDQTGTAVLTVPIFDRPVEGMASISGDNDSYRSAKGFLKVRVAKATLDELADQDVGFVKIDVEGHETVVLAGARRLIARQRPNVLIEVEERHVPGNVQSVFDYFRAEDYCGYFVLQSDLLSVDKFSPAFQADDLMYDGQVRKEAHYVNNFIFMPRERCGSVTETRILELLHAVRPAVGAPANVASARTADILQPENCP